jgi:hypothetical protein
MNDPVKALLDAGVLNTSPLAPTSRYYATGIAHLERTSGERIAYLKRRFLPSPERLVVVQQHPVAQGDRLDNLAALYLGDPELFWRLCDANGAIRPDELIERIGRRIVIALPEGMPG